MSDVLFDDEVSTRTIKFEGVIVISDEELEEAEGSLKIAVQNALGGVAEVTDIVDESYA